MSESITDTTSQEYRNWLTSLNPGDKVTVCEVRQGVLHRGRLQWYEVTIDRSKENKIVTTDKNDPTAQPRFVDGLITCKALANHVAIFPDGMQRGY